MALEMTPRVVNGIAVLALRGSLIEPADEGVSLSAAVAQLADAGLPEIAVNLDGVTQLDARGLGALVLAHRAARDRGGRLALVVPQPWARRMLAVTHLDRVFEVCGSEGELRSTAGRFGPFESFESFGSFDHRQAALSIEL